MSSYTQSPGYATHPSVYEDMRHYDALTQGDVQNERRPVFSGEKLHPGSTLMLPSEIPSPYTAQPYIHNSPIDLATQTGNMLDLTMRAPQVPTSNINIILVECNVHGTPKYIPVNRPNTHSPSPGFLFHSNQEYVHAGSYNTYEPQTYSPAYQDNSPLLPTPTATWIHAPSMPPTPPMSLAPSLPTQSHDPLYPPTTVPIAQEPLVSNTHHLPTLPTPPVPPRYSQSTSTKRSKKRAAKQNQASKPYETTRRILRTRRCEDLDWDPRAEFGDAEGFSNLQKGLQGIYTHRIFPCAWDGCRTQIRREDFCSPSGAEDYQRAIWNHLEYHFNPKLRDGSRANYRTVVIHVAQDTNYYFRCLWANCGEYTRAQSSKDMHRHVRTHLGKWKCICGACGQPFSRSDLLRKHEKDFHEKKKDADPLQVVDAKSAPAPVDVAFDEFD